MAAAVTVLVVAVDRTAARAEAAHVNRVPGFRTTATVGSAAAGLRRRARGDVDLVLLDRRLPDADGVELAARLREQGFRGDVLLITAPSDRADRLAGTALPPGVAGELVRPFAFDVVRDVLLTWKAARVAAPEAGERPARRSRNHRTGLPVGMRPDTLDAISVVVHQCCSQASAPAVGEPAGLTASAVASAVGASRLTVRRYLDHLADAGVLVRSLRRRSAGRPEAFYHPVLPFG